MMPRLEMSHLVVVLELDTLVHIPRCLEYAQAVCSQYLEHRVLVHSVVCFPCKVSILYPSRSRDHDGFEIDAGE